MPEVIAIVGVVKGGGTGVLGAPNPIPQKKILRINVYVKK